ncbi:MAG: hypothetical protein ACLQLC_10690 [Candidatus Sulfotelmatobacter sp.]
MLYSKKMLVLSILVFSASCGGGSSSSRSNSMSQAQAQTVSQQVLTTLGQALTSALTADAAAPSEEHPSFSAAIAHFHPDDSSGCTSTASGETCSFPVNFAGTCPGGGTIAVGGSVDGTLNNSGAGSLTADLTITPNSCSVSNLLISGDPSITVTTQINFTDTSVEFPVDATISGGISYGPHPSGNCQLNVTTTVSSETSASYSGTVCGQPVSGSANTF